MKGRGGGGGGAEGGGAQRLGTRWCCSSGSRSNETQPGEKGEHWCKKVERDSKSERDGR